MSKNKKMGRVAVPPPQSRGFRPALVPPVGPPGVVKQEIGELDALKYRLAIQKDNTLKERMNVIAGQKQLLAKEEENIKLKIDLVRHENKRDIGHLDIQNGDRLAEENGRYFIIRAPRVGSIPSVPMSGGGGTLAAPPQEPAPEPSEPAEPPGEPLEGEQTEGRGEAVPPAE